MTNEQIYLLRLFNQVKEAIKKNQANLNKADKSNHNHGDNMVEIFNVITQAVEAKKNASPSDQLEYAAKLLREESESESGSLYANGLEKTAKQVLGKDANDHLDLNLLEILMGELGFTDEVGQMFFNLSSFSVGTATGSYFNAKRDGKSDIEACTSSLLCGGLMAQSPHRAQSGELVASTLLKFIAAG